MPGMGVEESKVSFKGILFNKRRVRNEIKWKIRENYDKCPKSMTFREVRIF